MKKYLLSLSLFCFTVMFLHSQTDTPIRSIKIEAIDTIPKAKNNATLFKLNPIKGLTNKDFKHSLNYNRMPESFKKKTGIDLTAKSGLVNKKWEIKQKFSEDDKNPSKYYRDYYLGDLKTTSKTIVIKCRDHEYVDGDRIRLMINDAVIHPNLTLQGNFYTIDVDLNEGFNTINFVALNEGLSSPNTAELKVFDEDGKLLTSKRWLIRTGYKAKLIILKE